MKKSMIILIGNLIKNMFINKVQIYGNITRDIELKALPSGSSVCNFSVATNRTWKNKNGEKQEDAEFHSVVAFGKTADLIKQYLGKGRGIYIEGRLQTRSWQDKKTGEKKYRTEIIVEQMQFGHGGEKRERPAQDETTQGDSGRDDKGYEQDHPKEDEINASDLPF